MVAELRLHFLLLVTITLYSRISLAAPPPSFRGRSLMTPSIRLPVFEKESADPAQLEPLTAVVCKANMTRTCSANSSSDAPEPALETGTHSIDQPPKKHVCIVQVERLAPNENFVAFDIDSKTPQDCADAYIYTVQRITITPTGDDDLTSAEFPNLEGCRFSAGWCATGTVMIVWDRTKWDAADDGQFTDVEQEEQQSARENDAEMMDTILTWARRNFPGLRFPVLEAIKERASEVKNLGGEAVEFVVTKAEEAKQGFFAYIKTEILGFLTKVFYFIVGGLAIVGLLFLILRFWICRA